MYFQHYQLFTIIRKHLEECCDTTERNHLQTLITDIPDDPDTTPFNYKQKITGQTVNNRRRDVQIIVPLKYISNFWRTFEIINCEINFLFTLG